MKYTIKIIMLLLISLSLTSCNEHHVPIDADDFGFPKVTTYAKGQNVTGELDNQVSEWTPSGYKYNGDKIVTMVYNDDGTNFSTWSPWYCSGEDARCEQSAPFPLCIIPQLCQNPAYKYEIFENAPCYFEKGMGLYMLLTNPARSTVTDPNKYHTIKALPSSAKFFTTKMWDPTNMYSNRAIASGYVGDPGASPLGNSGDSYLGGRAYFKILDRYYDDNSGFYLTYLKRGFDRISPPPIARIISLVTYKLKSAANDLFVRITNNKDYHKALKAMLSLYMIIGGIMYIGGMSQMSHKELINLTIRLVIVIQLLTTSTSWEVFNGYFFNFFTLGLNEILGIITSNAATGSQGIFFFDNLLDLLFSAETNYKIMALIFSLPCGVVAVVIIYVAFIIFAVALAQAVMLYLLSYMAISLLIVLAPIFITFMLFKTTKPFFENWLNQFAVYFFQPVIVFAGLSLLTQLILSQMYLILGFRACYEDLVIVKNTVIMKFWKICSFDSVTSQKDTILLPGYSYCSDTSCTCTNAETNCGATTASDGTLNYFCAPYECTSQRYVDLPFLDLNKDASLIDSFSNGWTALNMPMLYHSSLLLLYSYLTIKFNDTAPIIAKGIAGGGQGQAMAKAASTVVDDAMSFASETADLASKGKYSKIKNRINAIKSKPGQLLDKYGAARKHVPWGEKSTIQKGMTILSSPFKMAHTLIRVAIPPGSLSAGKDGDEFKKAYNKERDE
jgi:type IV secretion system protein VirB6